jgi:hypothetical protein
VAEAERRVRGALDEWNLLDAWESVLSHARSVHGYTRPDGLA